MDGKESNISSDIQMQDDSRKCCGGSERLRKNYMVLKARTSLPESVVNGITKAVCFVVQKAASYEEALELAYDVFKVPDNARWGIELLCRPKGSPAGTQWMYIQPAVWTDIVDDMEFYVSGFRTELRPQ